MAPPERALSDEKLRKIADYPQVKMFEIKMSQGAKPGKVGWALAVGADFVTSARGFMFALGCIQALQCNKNTCPGGAYRICYCALKSLD